MMLCFHNTQYRVSKSHVNDLANLKNNANFLTALSVQLCAALEVIL